MITNERQYRITKSELLRFQAALVELDKQLAQDGENAVAKLHRSALASQVEEFTQLVEDYERLVERKPSIIEVANFGDLPIALIKARIATGLTQKELAERLDVKEQQVQRWEASGYANISFANLQRIVEALGVVVREEVFVPGPETTAANLVKKVKSLGVSRELLLARIIPSEFTDLFRGKNPQADEGVVFKVANTISRIFNLPLRALLTGDALTFSFRPVNAARFKAPANANESVLNVYALYAHYLAMLTAQATEHLPLLPIPTDWKTARDRILAESPRVDFKAALHFVWDCGVPVIPLDDSGAFNGAVWRIEGRNIIVLKQRKHFASYWLHDLLHEVRHAAEQPGEREFVLLESSPISPDRRESPEEETANDFAEDVIFGNRSDEIEDSCVTESKGMVQRLKTAIPRVAERYNVDQGYLANYMAMVLEQQKGINIWGVATNLQEENYSPFEYAREVFFERVALNRLNEVDREILLQGLRGGLEAYA